MFIKIYNDLYQYEYFTDQIQYLRIAPLHIYTSEDLKRDAPIGRISNQHWNLILAEIKWDILFLQGYKSIPV
jgi:hypothetical protein